MWVSMCVVVGCDEIGSQQAAETLHRSLRPGMAVRTVVLATEAVAVTKTSWSLGLRSCALAARVFQIGYSDRDNRYYIDEMSEKSAAEYLHRQLFSTRGTLLQALEDGSPTTCRELTLEPGGSWSIDVLLDSIGRVRQFSSPMFSG
jgi:hypothetical protein